MKKLIICFVVATAALTVANTSNLQAGNYAISIIPNSNLVQDTNPMPKRDTSKWNKKKHQDSSGRSRRDTMPGKH